MWFHIWSFVALDDFDSPLVITIAFALVILTVILFIALTLFLHKEDLKKIVTHFASRSKMQNNENIADIDNVVPKKEIHTIIDDNARWIVKIQYAICK